MPTKAAHHHHRARSSIDRVFDLLADLEDTQIALLLDDFNHTTSGNVPVSKAVALFEHGPTEPKHKFDRPSSPVSTLQAELERRHSKRLSSAPELVRRAKSASPLMVLHQPTEPTVNSPQPQAILPLRPSRPQLTLSPPELYERPSTADGQATTGLRPRSYKRISRPMFLSPTATAELHELLRAYLNDNPVSATTTATSSPTTPGAESPFLPFAHRSISPEPDIPALDLLEPSPIRLPPSQFIFGKAPMDPATSMSGIFEVLRSH